MLHVPLFRLKRQYFFAYAVVGSITPFLAIFLKQKGFDSTQIGSAIAMSNIAIMLTPVVLALLADTHCDSRRIMATVFGVSGLALLGLHFSTSPTMTIAFLCLQSLAYVGVFPLLDALSLSVREPQTRAEKDAGRAQVAVPYHTVRVWGTVGFILPSVCLFYVFGRGAGISWILFVGFFFCALGAWSALRLPAPLRATDNAGDAATARVERAAYLPTADAARALTRPGVRVFCVCLFLSNLAGAAYYAFFPLYLMDNVGVSQQWVGPITNVGVVFEIFFMIAFRDLLDKWGFKRLMLMGMGCMAARMIALAAFPVPAMAVAAQALHGMVVIAITVAPVMYLNLQAGDTYRNSMQGLYNMAIAGTSRMTGSFIAGYVARDSLVMVFTYASFVALLAAAIFLFAFHQKGVLQPQEA
jgi:PPP family 3-phenylpropionic acid transporter